MSRARRRHRPAPRTRLLVLIVALAMVATGCVESRATRQSAPLLLPINAQPSTIVAADGTLLTVLQEENRSTVPLSRIPRLMQNAVIAIEDERYWTHNGIDPKAIVRAAKENVSAGGVSQGGSTITQQYVKNVLLTPEKTISRKIEEASLAMQLERNYSKELILEQYLNTVYLGAGAYGVEAAARTYFDKGIAEVSPAEAALIAGLIQAPSQFDPHKNSAAATRRRNEVLKRMRAQEYLTEADYQAALAAPVAVVAAKPPPETVKYPAAHFVDEVKKWFLDNPTFGRTRDERRQLLLEGGLRIETTVDLGLQAKAEAAVRSVLTRPGTDPDAALVALDPRTGYVRAMVGGYDYFGTHGYAKVNLATSAQQPGSTFKTIALAVALDQGIGLDDRFDNTPQTYPSRLTGGDPWEVDTGGPRGPQPLRGCTIGSWNACYASLILDKRIRPQKVVEMAQRMGIRTKLNGYPSMVLGGEEATPLDVSSAFATIANAGMHAPATLVTRVVRADGTVLYGYQRTANRAMSAAAAYQAIEAMRGVIDDPSGTAHKTAQIGRPAAGKTGTTQNNKDAWFTGFTPELATTVSMGYAEAKVDRRGRRERPAMPGIYGGTKPAQIWAAFMRSALDGTPVADFTPPAADAPQPGATTTTTVPDSPLLAPVTTVGRRAVPDVTGMDIFEARAALTRAGFTSNRIVIADTGTGAGRVLAQSPPSGSQVPNGTRVTLETNPGEPPPTAPLPALLGADRETAVRRLQSGRWTVTTRVIPIPEGALRPDGSPYGGDQVWNMSPPAGTVSPDGQVTLTVTPPAPVPATPPAPAPTPAAPAP